MPTFDATAATDNSKLKEIPKTMKGQGLANDDGELVIVRDGIEVRLTGNVHVNKNGKIDKGKIFIINVKEFGGDDFYKISNMKISATKFLDAVYDGNWKNYVQNKLFDGNDTILGSFDESGDKLYGFDGKDKLVGYGGNDELHGGRGHDKLKGSAGDDAFVFDTKLNPKNNVDTIKDWNYLKGKGGGTDAVWLDAGIFKAFKGMKGDTVSDKNFVVGKKAKTDDQFLIFKENNNGPQKIYYDLDGAGGESKVLFAKVSGNHTLDADDFLIV